MKLTPEKIASVLGVSDYTKIEEASLPGQQIQEIGSLANCKALKKLHLQGNRFQVWRQIEGVFYAPNLEYLDLSASPVSRVRKYREYVISHCSPTLKYLDTKPITQQERSKANAEFPNARKELKGLKSSKGGVQNSTAGFDIFGSITDTKKPKKTTDSDSLSLFGDDFSIPSQSTTKKPATTTSTSTASTKSNAVSSIFSAPKKATTANKNISNSFFGGDDIFSSPISKSPTKKADTKSTIDDIFSSGAPKQQQQQQTKPSPAQDSQINEDEDDSDDLDIDNIETPDDIFGEDGEIPDDDLFGGDDFDLDSAPNQSDSISEQTNVKQSSNPVENETSPSNSISEEKNQSQSDENNSTSTPETSDIVYDSKFDLDAPVKPRQSLLSNFEDSLFSSNKSSSSSLFGDDNDDFSVSPKKSSTTTKKSNSDDLFNDTFFSVSAKQKSNENSSDNLFSSSTKKSNLFDDESDSTPTKQVVQVSKSEIIPQPNKNSPDDIFDEPDSILSTLNSKIDEKESKPEPEPEQVQSNDPNPSKDDDLFAEPQPEPTSQIEQEVEPTPEPVHESPESNENSVPMENDLITESQPETEQQKNEDSDNTLDVETGSESAKSEENQTSDDIFAEPQSESEVEAKVEPQQEPEPEPESEPQSEPEPEPEPEQEPEPEPEPEQPNKSVEEEFIEPEQAESGLEQTETQNEEAADSEKQVELENESLNQEAEEEEKENVQEAVKFHRVSHHSHANENSHFALGTHRDYKSIVEESAKRCFHGNGISSRVLFSALDKHISFVVEVTDNSWNILDEEQNYDCSVDCEHLSRLMECFSGNIPFAAALLDESMSTDDPIRFLAFVTAFHFVPSVQITKQTHENEQIKVNANDDDDDDEINSSQPSNEEERKAKEEEEKRLEEERKRKEEEEQRKIEEEKRKMEEEENRKKRQLQEQEEKNKWGEWYDIRLKAPILVSLLVTRLVECYKAPELPKYPIHFVLRIKSDEGEKFSAKISLLKSEIIVAPCSNDESGDCCIECSSSNLENVLCGKTLISMALMTGLLIPQDGMDYLPILSEAFDFTVKKESTNLFPPAPQKASPTSRIVTNQPKPVKQLSSDQIKLE